MNSRNFTFPCREGTLSCLAPATDLNVIIQDYSPRKICVNGLNVKARLVDFLIVPFGKLQMIHTWPATGLTAEQFRMDWLRDHPAAQPVDLFLLLFYRVC
jgi:hypothetical protein